MSPAEEVKASLDKASKPSGDSTLPSTTQVLNSQSRATFASAGSRNYAQENAAMVISLKQGDGAIVNTDPRIIFVLPCCCQYPTGQKQDAIPA